MDVPSYTNLHDLQFLETVCNSKQLQVSPSFCAEPPSHLIVVFRALGPPLPRMRLVRSPYIPYNHAAMPPYLRLLIIYILRWPLRGNHLFVLENKQWSVAGEVAVQVF